MYFVIDGTALWITGGFLILYGILLWRRTLHSIPYLFFPDLRDLKAAPKTWRVSFHRLPRFIYQASLFCFVIAFLDPRLELPQKSTQNKQAKSKAKKIYTEGLAIYLLLDQSGSMGERVITDPGHDKVSMPTKIQLLKEVTRDFILGDPEHDLQGRDNDLLGLVTFARTAQIITPLTLDHETLLNELKKVDVIKDPTQDGTAMGYAIYKTANLIAATKHFAEDLITKGKPSYELKGTAIIVITDGFQSPHPEDKGNRWKTMGIEEAAQFAKSEGIHLYIINIDPAIDLEEYAPQRRLMIRATEATGGKFFPVADASRLYSIYSEIDQLEKSIIPEPQLAESKQTFRRSSSEFRYLSFYLFFISLGMVALFAAVLSETFLFKSVP